MLTPPSVQCHSQCWGLRFSFPNCWQRGTPGDLTSLLSKDNGWAFSGTDRMLENGTLGKRSPTRHVLTHQSWQ